MGRWTALKERFAKAPVELKQAQKINIVKEEMYKGLKPGRLGELFSRAKDKKAALEAEIKDLNVHLDALTQLLVQSMEDAGLEQYRLSDGTLLSLADDIFPAMKDRDVFMTWVHERSLDSSLMMHPGTLKSLVASLIESGEPPPPGIEVFMKSKINRPHKGSSGDEPEETL